jgi:SAM-dependent methyltransferase
MVNAASGLAANLCSQHSTFRPEPDPAAVKRLDPQPGELILDVGCGDGMLTAKIAESGAKVIGLDSSEEMVELTRARGIDAFLADPEVLDLPAQAERFGQFDAVFSNSALHWMKDPDAVAGGIFLALKEGGRFVGEMGGAGDLARLWNAFIDELSERGYSLPPQKDLWFPDVEEFARLHCVTGFTDVEAELVERPTDLPDGASGWVMANGSAIFDLAMVPQWERSEIAEAVERRLGDALRSADGLHYADHVRLRFSMRKPG